MYTLIPLTRNGKLLVQIFFAIFFVFYFVLYMKFKWNFIYEIRGETQNDNFKKGLEIYDPSNINVRGQENSMKQGNISKTEDNKHENKQENSDTTSMCQSMFTVMKPSKTSQHFGAALKAIQELGENVARGVAGLTDPYNKLADLLPSQIQMVNRETKFTSRPTKKNDPHYSFMMDRLKSILKNSDADPSYKTKSTKDIDSIRKFMVVKQNEFSYNLIGKNVADRLQGDIPFIPCKMRHSFSDEEITQCGSKVSPLHIAFWGDSKIRNLYQTFLMETSVFNYRMVS